MTKFKKTTHSDEDEEYLISKASLSDAVGPAGALMLQAYAKTLDKAPENKRYDIELTIDESGMDDD